MKTTFKVSLEDFNRELMYAGSVGIGFSAVEAKRSAAAFEVDAYRCESAGERMVPVFLDMASRAKRDASETVLDAGCGTGRGIEALAKAGFRVIFGCDIVDAGRTPTAQQFPFTTINLWDDRAMQMEPVDWGYCCDVLEHIPEPLTMLAVRNLLSIARKGVFVTVSTGPDVHGVWVGEPLHQTVKSFTWWRKHLGAVGDMLQARDLLDHGAFLVTRC